MTRKPPDWDLRFASRCIHEAQDPEGWGSSTLPPIHQSASHWFETGEKLSDTFAGKEKNFIYMRLRNPTNQVLERKIAALEGGMEAVAVSSGMAAVTDSLLAILRHGDEIVAGNSLFMSTYLLFRNVFRKFGIRVRMVDPTDLDAWKGALGERTKALYCETIGNPKMDCPDIPALAALAHENAMPLIVDNTMATPYLVRPIEHGADIVVHSTTKFFSGHGDAVGGIIIDAGRFDWPEERYPDFAIYKERQGKRAYIDKVWREIHINFGSTYAPFHAYLTCLGLDTLALRMERHNANALALAERLEDHEKVRWVRYPGLPGHPDHAMAERLFGGRGHGALLTIGLENQEACFDFIRNLSMSYHLANLGDCKTLVIHPYSSQYISFDEETKRALSITPDLIRVSVGIEAIEDIVEDFERALASI